MILQYRLLYRQTCGGVFTSTGFAILMSVIRTKKETTFLMVYLEKKSNVYDSLDNVHTHKQT